MRVLSLNIPADYNFWLPHRIGRLINLNVSHRWKFMRKSKYNLYLLISTISIVMVHNQYFFNIRHVFINS